MVRMHGGKDRTEALMHNNYITIGLLNKTLDTEILHLPWSPR